MSQYKELDEQIIALSALMLVVEGVDTLAHKGQWPQENLMALLPSLMRFNADNMFDFYDHIHCLEQGRQALLAFLSKDIEVNKMRYALQLMHVENKLSKKQPLMQVLQQRLSAATNQVERYGLMHDNVLANFADIYTETASKAANKIMISGSPNLLQQQENINRIRSLLLCGVRACALWRANGGSRWQLILARSGIEARARLVSYG